MIKFEKVAKFADIEFDMPCRKTANSAGYDFVVVEDTIIPPYNELMGKFDYHLIKNKNINNPLTLDEMAKITKETKAKPTLVPTGVKAYMPKDTYLELSVRSSCPLKYWLILANGVGIIDADYVDNPDNEGAIYFQLINLSTMPVKLQKGDIIGQGIFKKYLTADNDSASGERVGGFGSTSV